MQALTVRGGYQQEHNGGLATVSVQLVDATGVDRFQGPADSVAENRVKQRQNPVEGWLQPFDGNAQASDSLL